MLKKKNDVNKYLKYLSKNSQWIMKNAFRVSLDVSGDDEDAAVIWSRLLCTDSGAKAFKEFIANEELLPRQITPAEIKKIFYRCCGGNMIRFAETLRNIHKVDAVMMRQNLEALHPVSMTDPVTFASQFERAHL